MASTRKIKTKRTELECPDCHNIQTIYRRIGKMREKNHIKHMYCWICRETTGHIERGEDVHLPDWVKEMQQEEEELDNEEEFDEEE